MTNFMNEIKKTRQKTEELELAFDTLCIQSGLPTGEKMHQHIGDGKWFEIDRWFTGWGVGVELNEELFHKQWSAQARDARKRNYCVLHDIPLLTFTGTQLTNDPAGCIEIVKAVLKKGGWS